MEGHGGERWREEHAVVSIEFWRKATIAQGQEVSDASNTSLPSYLYRSLWFLSGRRCGTIAPFLGSGRHRVESLKA
jgi:hypothetical protein